MILRFQNYCKQLAEDEVGMVFGEAPWGLSLSSDLETRQRSVGPAALLWRRAETERAAGWIWIL